MKENLIHLVILALVSIGVFLGNPYAESLIPFLLGLLGVFFLMASFLLFFIMVNDDLFKQFIANTKAKSSSKRRNKIIKRTLFVITVMIAASGGWYFSVALYLIGNFVLAFTLFTLRNQREKRAA